MSTGNVPARISFDVFDTLITRAVGSPVSVFLLLGRELATDGLLAPTTPEQFARARQTAEAVARTWHPAGEVTLEAIYAELIHALPQLADRREQVARRELELELTLSRVVPSGIRALRSAAVAGRQIMLVSDTYLPASFIRAALAPSLPVQDTPVWTSGEAGANKASGALFRMIGETHGPAADWRHVGDNITSDLVSPRILGIQATLAADTALTRYESALEGHAYDTGGLAATFAGAARLARLSLSPPRRSQRDQALLQVATGVAGPLLTAFVLWVLQDACRVGVKRLYFIARDGEMLHEIAQRLMPKLGLELDLRYFYSSRRVVMLAALRPGELRRATWAYDGVWGSTIDETLARLDVDGAAATRFLRRHGLDQGSPTRSTDPQQARRLGSLLADPEFEQLVLASAERHRHGMARYLAQEDAFDPPGQIAFVDTGWIGRSAEALSKVFLMRGRAMPRLYLVGLHASPYGWSGDGVISPYLFDEPHGRGWMRHVMYPAALVETFCSATHGATTAYRVEDEVTPVLGPFDGTRRKQWGVELVRRAVHEFVDHLHLDPRHVDVHADMRPAVAQAAQQFWQDPTRSEAEIWGDYVFEDDPLGRSTSVLARPWGLRDLAHPIRMAHNPGRRLWIEGSIRRSPLPLQPILSLGWRLRRRGLARM